LISRSQQRSERFDVLLGQSIDEAVTSLLSADVVDALYLNLERFHSIPRNEVPRQLKTLSITLEKTFGESSSKTIGKAIAKSFYAKMEIDFPKRMNPDWTLLDFIDRAKVGITPKNKP